MADGKVILIDVYKVEPVGYNTYYDSIVAQKYSNEALEQYALRYLNEYFSRFNRKYYINKIKNAYEQYGRIRCEYSVRFHGEKESDIFEFTARQVEIW